MKHNLCILLLFISIYPVFGATTAENDTLLRVLREELAADFAELQQQDVKPYFMSFRVQETHRAIIASTFGFLANSNQERVRQFTPQIRVGSAELDNFKFNPQSSVGSVQLPLTDASPDAFRATIWSHMLNAYDRVANEYRSVQNRLRTQADNEDKAPCFSVLSGSPAETYYEAPLAYTSLTLWPACKWSLVVRTWSTRREPLSCRTAAASK